MNLVDGHLVSVIIPVFNGELFLSNALDSVFAQDYRPIEVIVVDDGSTDGTSRIIQMFSNKVRSTYQTNAGPPVARNRGVEMAEGNMIAFLDSDDLWPKNKLEVQLARLTANPTPDIVLGHLQYFSEIIDSDGKCRMNYWTEPRLIHNLGAALIRKSAFDQVGYFDETLPYSDDWDWFVRAREHGLVIITEPTVTVLSRRHARNLSNQREMGDRYTLRMIKKTLDRRRNRDREGNAASGKMEKQ